MPKFLSFQWRLPFQNRSTFWKKGTFDFLRGLLVSQFRISSFSYNYTPGRNGELWHGDCGNKFKLLCKSSMFPQMQDVLWKGYIVDLASWWESEMQFIHVHPTVYLTRLCLFFQWMRDGHNSIQKSSGLLKECEQRDAHSESRRALPNPSKLSGLSLLAAPGFTQRSPLMLDRSIDAKIMVITETFWLNTNWCLDASPSVWFCGLANISASCFNTFA